jgi:hypothetical protein
LFLMVMLFHLLRTFTISILVHDCCWLVVILYILIPVFIVRYLHLLSDWFHVVVLFIILKGDGCILDALMYWVILRILLTLVILWLHWHYDTVMRLLSIRWPVSRWFALPVTFILLMMTFCHSSYCILLFYGIRTHCCAFIACIGWLFILLLLSLTILLLFITSILLSVSDYIVSVDGNCLLLWWHSVDDEPVDCCYNFSYLLFPFYLLLLLMETCWSDTICRCLYTFWWRHWLLCRYWCAVIVPVF